MPTYQIDIPDQEQEGIDSCTRQSDSHPSLLEGGRESRD